ncbi:MAG: NUDIX domain-containing protein [Acidobacteriaceae bacterium]
MTIGRFNAGIAAVIWSPETSQYLFLRRAEHKDYAPGVWEWVTGRVEQGEGYEDALHREVREELGASVHIEHILGTTHFYRGSPSPDNELLGVVYLCTLASEANIRIGPEHAEFRWLSAGEALGLLSASDSSTQWTRRVLQRLIAILPRLSEDLMKFQRQSGFEFG